MIGFDVKLDEAKIKSFERLAEKGFFKSLTHAAAAIRATARSLIVRSSEPSTPGEPIHTKRGKAKRSDAVLYVADESADDAVVGFTFAAMGESMSAHEHGGEYLGTDFPARPVMAPALEANLIRFADEFQGSLGE